MIDFMDLQVKFATETVRQACRLVRQVQKDMVTPALTKSDRSPVTVADFACQALVGSRLAQVFPQDPLVAEEDSQALCNLDNGLVSELVTSFVQREIAEANTRTVNEWIDHNRADSAARFWTLDPVDGTKGFLRGDQYAIALALVVNGRVQIGVLGCPNLRDACQVDMSGPGSLVIAVRGQGTWTTSLSGGDGYHQLRVSNIQNTAQARILRSFESDHTNVSQIDIFTHALGVETAPVRMDSQAKYAVLAAGAGDLLLRLLSTAQPDYCEKIWDQAAGSLVLEEAGGQISDLHGRPLDFTRGRELSANHGILASNGYLHPAALKALGIIST